MTEPIDVAIIGGGVAGTALALALTQCNRRVVVLEREATPALNGADVVKPAGIAVLRKLGVFPEVLARGRRRERVDIFYDSAFMTALDYKEDPVDDFFVLTPYSSVLDVLCGPLTALDPAAYRCGTPVSAVELDGERVNGLLLASGETVRARYYVGADGARSFMRAQLGLPGERVEYAQKLFFGKFPIVPSVDELNRLYVASSNALAYFYPIGRSHFRAVLGFEPDVAAQLVTAGRYELRAALAEFVSASPDALAALGPLRDFARIPVARMHASRYGCGNFALLGDAAHCVHPITGQGMNLGIEDAGSLGDWLVRALSGECSGAECIAGYQRERWPVNRAVVDYGHALASSMHDRHAFVANFDRQMQASRRRERQATEPMRAR